MTKYDSFKPGSPWLDTEGKPIQAHGGSLIFADGIAYWIGENKEFSMGNKDSWGDREIWHWGMRCYSSTDLYNWKDEGIVLPPVPDDPADPMHPAQSADRPHVLYHERDKRFVMWVKVMGTDGIQFMLVSVADRITGPYERVGVVHPCGLNSGDFDLVKDPLTKRAYIYFERVHSDLICADLTDDYLNCTGCYTAHFPYGHPPFVREAPAFFERKGKKYLFTSGTTGYFPNRSAVAVAQSYHGPWREIGDPHVGDGTNTSFHSQITSVFRHPDHPSLYIALADRWLTDLPDDISFVPDLFDLAFSGKADEKTVQKKLHETTKEVTSKATYVWLPVEFDGDRPFLRWRDEWRWEDFTG